MNTPEQIQHHMTHSAVTIGQDQTMETAHKLMEQHHVRHLPVLDGGRIVGIVSERDLQLLETLRDVRPADVRVEAAMTPDPYTVSPQASLSVVAHEMARHKYGAAVVAERGRVLGIFTTVDALNTVVELLSRVEGQPPRAN